VFNATFSSISAISWQPVLVVEEAKEYPVRTTDHGQITGKLVSLAVTYFMMAIVHIWE
jgi:hypothetical protein